MLRCEEQRFKEEQERKRAEKHEEAFRIDLDRELDRRDKNGNAMMVKMVSAPFLGWALLTSVTFQIEATEVNKRLSNFEEKIRRHQLNKERQIKEKIDRKHSNEHEVDKDRLQLVQEDLKA